jgi:hypothetical protein
MRVTSEQFFLHTKHRMIRTRMKVQTTSWIETVDEEEAWGSSTSVGLELS